MRNLAISLVIASLSVAAPRPAAAAATDVYDTVDAVEIDVATPGFNSLPSLQVTGIPAGGTTPTTIRYLFSSLSPPGNLDAATHCHRLAVVAMSKPGKFRFAIGPGPGAGLGNARGCKLTLRTP